MPTSCAVTPPWTTHRKLRFFLGVMWGVPIFSCGSHTHKCEVNKLPRVRLRWPRGDYLWWPGFELKNNNSRTNQFVGMLRDTSLSRHPLCAIFWAISCSNRAIVCCQSMRIFFYIRSTLFLRISPERENMYRYLWRMSYLQAHRQKTFSGRESTFGKWYFCVLFALSKKFPVGAGHGPVVPVLGYGTATFSHSGIWICIKAKQ